MTVNVNDRAPDFELGSTDGSRFRLSDMTGQGPVLLNFYVGDFGINCINYITKFNERIDELTDLGVTFVGINSDSMESHIGFKSARGIRWELLFDKDKTVAKEYGAIVGPGHMVTGFTNRELFLVDTDMTVRYKWKAAIPKDLPQFDDVLAGVRAALQ